MGGGSCSEQKGQGIYISHQSETLQYSVALASWSVTWMPSHTKPDGNRTLHNQLICWTHTCAANNKGRVGKHNHTKSSYWRDGSLQFTVLLEAPGRGRWEGRKDASSSGREPKTPRDRLIAPDGTPPAEVRSLEDVIHRGGRTAPRLVVQNTLLEIENRGLVVSEACWAYQRALFLKLVLNLPLGTTTGPFQGQ